MKRILRILLAVSLTLVCLAPMASATETEATEAPETTEAVPQREPGQCGEDMTWEFQDGTLTITGNGAMDDFPDGPQWAEHKEEITVVKLVGNISTIGAHAFTNYDKIVAVDFGKALQEIDVAAFLDCDGLTTISLPDTFRRFGEDSFRNCPNLKEIHCDGRFPSFNLNCLWNTRCKIYFPEERPWSVEYIQQLEEAFKGRIEFLASDGSDPYEPTEPEETTEATEETVPPTTEPAVTEPATTEAPTETPTEAPTVPSTEETAETTQTPTETPTTPPTQPVQTEEPQPEPTESKDIEQTARGGLGGLLVISGVMCALILGALLFRRRRY